MTDNEYKYSCKSCNFYTNALTKWEIHEKTGKHQSGGVKRKPRRDMKQDIKCPKCEYENRNLINMKCHILNNHSTNQEREKGFKHYCKRCDYGTFAKPRYEYHLSTQAHIDRK